MAPAPVGRLVAAALAAILLALTGCGGEPSRREILNARAFEALLTAVSLTNKSELEKDAKTIEERHEKGELSHAHYQTLQEIIAKARAGDWKSAESRAYEFRKQFGDRGAYFD
jgi:hypothetical protein